MPIHSCSFELGSELRKEVTLPDVSARSIKELYERLECDELFVTCSPSGFEAFAACDDGERFSAGVAGFLHQKTGLPTKRIQGRLQTRASAEAVRRFFARAVGIETDRTLPHNVQIFRSQFELARRANSVGPLFSKLNQRGLWLAEKVRLESNLQKSAITEESVVTDLAQKIFGDLHEHKALVWTNGPECEAFVRKLADRRIGELLFAGGSAAENLCARHNGRMIDVDTLPSVLAGVDLLLIFDEQALPVLLQLKFADIMHKRRNAPMLMVRLVENDSSARGKDPFARFYNVYSYDRGDLESIVAANLKERQKVIDITLPLIEKEVDDFFSWLNAKEQHRFGNIIGKSAAMQNLLDLIARIAQTDISVLIDGESGTGKELVARSIHEHSRRVNNAFIAVNCGALPESLLESELFGYVKGAFTGASGDKKGLIEEAEHGTVFLDEIGETSQATQVKLLRFLQEGEIKPVGSNEIRKLDVRVLTATNRDLEQMVHENRFRQDLFYRLNVIQMTIPPLRERPEDIVPLVNYFVEKYSKQMHKTVYAVSEEAIQSFLSYRWPGNVRELENAIERAVALAAGDVITVSDLPPTVTGMQNGTSAHPYRTANMTLKELEKQHIAAMLEEHEWNYDLVTQLLGIGRTTLWRKMKEYGISNQEGS